MATQVTLNSGSVDSAGSLALKTNGTTTAVTIDTSQNVGIGTSSPAYKLDVSGVISSNDTVRVSGGTTVNVLSTAGGGEGVVGTSSNHALQFRTNNTERARIDSSGNLLVNITTSVSYGLAHRIFKSGTQGASVLSVDGGTEFAALFFNVTGGNYSANSTAISVGRNTSTLRSINAGGTVNASGADYAEYMTKAGDFAVAKGDVVGINVDGKLTNVFADAVSFCVKSTDPSYVGGDIWGNEDAIGKKPSPDAPQEEQDAFEAALEAARQTVDRIAFAGQVPVNVLGATAGQYIIPVNDNGAIKGEAVNEADMTLTQYMKAVGKVIAIESDGRAKIIVKVA